jgi:hypothetical protein
VFSARAPLISLLTNPTLPFTYCKPAGGRLVNAIDAILQLAMPSEGTEQANVNWSAPLEQRAFEITNALQVFDNNLAAELGMQDTYVVSRKGIYSTSELIERADNLFSENVRAQLPEDAKRDINEAGRCLAFDLPTAAGMHILRALEAVMLEYLKKRNAKPLKDSQRNWGQYVAKLREADADQKVVSALDQIRELHRNPTMHPEVFLSTDEALALLGLAQSAILAMMADMHRDENTPADAVSVSDPEAST